MAAVITRAHQPAAAGTAVTAPDGDWELAEVVRYQFRVSWSVAEPGGAGRSGCLV